MSLRTDTVILPPRLFPAATYYSAILHARGGAVVDTATRYDKRCKAVHRYDIIDARGRLQLTVPLGKPHGCEGFPTWADTAVSTHDEWWHRHRTSLESAYGRTPYFEFLIDKFDGVFRSPAGWGTWPNALDLIREANRVVCGILDIAEPSYGAADSAPSEVCDLRDADFRCPNQPPYWQVRQHLFGFAGGLSILDLIFNLGPEARLYLSANNLTGCIGLSGGASTQ